MKKWIHILTANREKLLVIMDQAWVSGMNFIIGVLLARFLGLDQYGLFVIGWMAVLFTSSLHLAFIIKPLYTLLPKQNNKASFLASLMGVQSLFSILTFLLVTPIVYVLVIIYPEWSLPYISLNIGAVCALFILNDYIRRVFFVLHKPLAALFHDILYFVVQIVLFGYFIWADQLSVSTALLSANIALGFACLTSIFINYRNGISFKNLLSICEELWRFSKFLVGTALLQWVSGNLFIAMAAVIIGPVAVGAIRMVQNIIGVLHVLFLSMENIVPMRASEVLQQDGRKSMIKYMVKITKQSAVPAILLIGLILVFSKQIIGLLYGAEYVQFQGVLVSFCALYVFVFFGTLLRFLIRTVELNKVIFVSYVLTAVASIVLAKPLVSHFQIAGVMIGLFIMQLITIGIYIYSLKSDLKWIFK